MKLRLVAALLCAQFVLRANPLLAAPPTVTVSPNATTIPRYEIYELTMAHGTTYTYPNDDVTITNVFTMPSGKTFTVGGFYYDTGTWKTRFAPLEVGTYTWTLSFDNGSGSPYTTSGSFTCTASGNTGFLVIDPANSRRFITQGDGKPFFINGLQKGLINASNPSPMTQITGQPPVAIPIAASFSTWQRAGLNIWRYNWQLQDSGNPYLTRLNNSSTGKNTWSVSEGKRIDEEIMAIHQSGLKHMQTLSIASLTSNWDVAATGNSAALTNYVKHFINRWGAYTDIWEIGNELNGITQPYLNVVTSAFHANDPYNHALTNTYQAPNLDESGLTTANSHSYKGSTNLNLDHDWVYSTGPSATGVGQYLGATISGVYIPSMRDLYPNKPIYSGECGNTAPYGTYDPERYRIPVWTANLNDSGVIYWVQLNKSATLSGGYSNMYIGTEERAMNKVFANLVTDLDDQVSPVATASVVCSPAASVHGYVTGSSQNLMGYFLHTTSHASTLAGATVTLPIPASNMRGQWIDPATGAILQEFTVNSGTQTLSIPTFQVDAGLRIRPASAAPIIEFARASYVTFENQGSVTITVNRSNNSAGAVSVHYATSDGLALAGTNYTAASGTLTWASGDMAPKTFTVALQDDGVAAQDRDFQIFLSSPTGGATLEGNVNTLVAVCDDATNFNPLISSAATATTSTTTALNYTITGTGSPTSFNATNLPTGLSVNTATGLISGTVATAGTYTINLFATAAGGTGSGTLTLTVNPPAPVINSANTASATTTAAFSYTITATNNPTSYNATGLPPGLSVSTTTGVISGTPTQVGTFTTALSATNVTGTGTLNLTVTVTTPGAPVISSAASATGTQGSPFSFTIAASPTPASYSATGLPTGLTLNTTTGVISGTPASSGVSSVVLYATNTAGSGAQTVNFTIYQQTGGVRFAYEDFNYTLNSTISTDPASSTDYGFTGTTWTGASKIVAGLTYSGIPVANNGLQFSSNVSCSRYFNLATVPVGTTLVDTDGVTRVGKPGTTIWVRVLLQPLADTNLADACNLQFLGTSSGGAGKLSLGNLGSTVVADEGYWSVYHSSTAQGKSAVPITAGTTVMLVARLSFGSGTNADQVDFYVNPPTATTPPATPDVSLRGFTISPVDRVQFTGFRTCNGDELSVGTDWISAVAPNAQGFLGFNSAAYSQHEGTSGTVNALVTVSRYGGSSGAVTVHYATSDGTAAAGTDYTATSGTLTWADGDAADKTFTVPVYGKSAYAQNKSVNLTVSSPTGGAALSSQSTATLTLINDNAQANIPPTAVDDYATMNKNSQLANILVMANDSDPDGDTLSITSVGAPSHGTAQINPVQPYVVIYTPTPSYAGADSFTYTISDGQGGSATATVHVTVLAKPRLTIMPLGDSITVGITSGLVTPAQGYRGPLLNSLNGAGVPIQYLGANNTGIFNNDSGAMSCEGHSGYIINDLVSNLTGNNNRLGNGGGYWLTGGNGTGRNAVSPDIVLLEIGGNDASGGGTPTPAQMQGYLQNVLNILKTNLPNAQVFVASLIPRTNSTYESVSVQYSAGIPSMCMNMGANFHFVDLHTNFPSNGLSTDGTHPVQTGYDWMASQWLAAIQTIVHPPVAGTDTAATAVSTPVTIPVLSNDSDPDGFLPLAVASAGAPAHGAVAVNADNTITYTPVTGYSGGDSFAYTVMDGRSATASGTVNVTVSGQAYAGWAASNGLTGGNADPTASPAHDGIPNLIKYALGLNPNKSATLPTDGVTPGLPRLTLEGANLCLLYQKDTSKVDLTYTTQVCTDLQNWGTAGITETLQTTTGSVQTIKTSVPMGTDPRKFLRLQIARQP